MGLKGRYCNFVEGIGEGLGMGTGGRMIEREGGREEVSKMDKWKRR
jgi:hypothetical protein